MEGEGGGKVDDEETAVRVVVVCLRQMTLA